MAKSLKQTYQMNATPEEVWEALVNPKKIKEWSGSSAEMSEREGAKFKLWDGEIHGTNVSLKSNEELVQDWYGGDWPEASHVTFKLVPKDTGTEVTLLHENIPNEEENEIANGWKRYYLGPMKEMFE